MTESQLIVSRESSRVISLNVGEGGRGFYNQFVCPRPKLHTVDVSWWVGHQQGPPQGAPGRPPPFHGGYTGEHIGIL